jgi:hypothetical protein
MRPANPIESSARRGPLVAALALLLASFVGPPAFAQSGGALAPDPAPGATAPVAPDPAPGANADRLEPGETSQPPATTSPDSTPSDPTASAPEASTPVIPVPSEAASSERAAVPRGSQPRHGARKGARRKARGTRKAGQDSRVAGPSAASVFRAELPLARLVGGDTDAERPPVELIALALLTLVLAGAALLTLTTRLTRMAGLAPPGRGPAS